MRGTAESGIIAYPSLRGVPMSVSLIFLSLALAGACAPSIRPRTPQPMTNRCSGRDEAQRRNNHWSVTLFAPALAGGCSPEPCIQDGKPLWPDSVLAMSPDDAIAACREARQNP